jgi:putative nucleotidyltransferase with HDIG domain
MTKLTRINKISFSASVALIFLLALISGINPVVPAVLACLFAYIKLKQLKCSLRQLLLLFLLVFTPAYFMAQRGLSLLYLPFTAIPMLSVILFGQIEISLLLSLAAAISLSGLPGGNFILIILFFISGSVAGFLLQDVRRRVEIIKAGFIIGVLQAALLLILEHFRIFAVTRYPVLFLNGIGSGFIVLGLLPLFELLFNTTTNISLLELADVNHPLLQRMIMEALGTYHHSLVVGNLSEAACRAVGANALLARIGAYYHDVGKLEKAGYFSENQNLGASKHDSLSATMSKMVIMNHVREGAELAKRYKLNPRIIDFIVRHHGNSLVYYFYRRALESLEEDQEVREEGFRYPGPKPNSKETAIVLLADSVEAATRTLSEPAPAKIEEVVHRIINNKFIDGQLDDCDLTLKDLEIIAAVFVRILNGIYHSRIPYPEKDLKSENNHKKSAKENSHLSEKDKKSSS